MNTDDYIPDYIPGQGYTDGYQDRSNGLANRSVVYAQTNPYLYDPYWSDYSQGYAEAERRIIEQAKQGIQESKRYLAE